MMKYGIQTYYFFGYSNEYDLTAVFIYLESLIFVTGKKQNKIYELIVFLNK